MIPVKMIGLAARGFRVRGDRYRPCTLPSLPGGTRTVNQIIRKLGGNQPNMSKAPRGAEKGDPSPRPPKRVANSRLQGEN